MSRSALPQGTRAVLLDIEGTVGDVRFVADVLFPHARRRLASFVAAHAETPLIRTLLHEAAGAARISEEDQAAVVGALEAWSDANAKVKPLKDLQGLIWEEGYRTGELRAHVYDDVPPTLRAWKDRGLGLSIYSSGSVLAQKLYFAHSTVGDLAPLFDAWFDTSSGSKGDAASYVRIARSLAVAPDQVAFFSDAPVEIAAARTAGMHATRIDRARPPGDFGRDPSGNDWSASLVAD